MERVVLFDQPMRLDYFSKGKERDERGMPAYGFRVPHMSYTLSDMVGYMEYLVGAQRWYAIGNDIGNMTWKTKDGNRYHVLSPEIKAFIEQANREHQVSARLFETDLFLKRRKGVVKGFIADAELARTIREDGRVLDVLTCRSEEKGLGV